MILIPKHIREQFERIGELDEPLAALEPLGAVREWLRESELHAIKQASEGGASLARIGNALGTDKQNIHQKLRMSQAGFDGGLDSRMLSWGEEILRCHVETEQISEGADRAGRPAGA